MRGNRRHWEQAAVGPHAGSNRKGCATRPRRRLTRRGRLWVALAALLVLVPVLGWIWQLATVPPALPISQALPAPVFAPTTAHADLPHGRVYFVEQRAEGFRLMASDVNGASIPLALLPDNFGQDATDAIATVALAPGGAYLAIDGERDHGDILWILDTATGNLRVVPPDALGTFLHWLPDGEHFLFRAFLPQGSVTGTWTPGLWIVDAATGAHQAVPDPAGVNATVIDAVANPSGTGLVISTTLGVGQGSTVWALATDGSNPRPLWSAAATIGLFAWSPDGQTLAYEALADSTVPYRPASLWLAAPDGSQQREVAQVDGGHGWSAQWSPDGQQIAFVARLNAGDSTANALAGQLVSAVQRITPATGKVVTIASPALTGQPRNIAPTWTSTGTLIFDALPASNASGAALVPAHLWQAQAVSAEHFELATFGAGVQPSNGLIAIVP